MILNSSRIPGTLVLNGGKIVKAVSQTRSKLTPKYWWVSLSRVPVICRQGCSFALSRTSARKCLVASPMISMSRTTASWISELASNASLPPSM